MFFKNRLWILSKGDLYEVCVMPRAYTLGVIVTLRPLLASRGPLAWII